MTTGKYESERRSQRAILLFVLFLFQHAHCFLHQITGRGRVLPVRPASHARIVKAAATKSDIEKEVDFRVLKELDQCRTGTAARKVLERAFGGAKNALYGSITIPAGASDRSISDSDLAIQTKIRNKKYGIFDLIDLNGNRDADRASAGVLGVFLGSSLSAIAANQNMPGPEILRFLVVWLLSFAPLAFVGYGVAAPENLQALLVALQRTIFPTYRKRMIQHEAGHFLISHLLGLPIQGYSANSVKNAVEFYPLNDQDIGMDRASQLGFDRKTKSESNYDAQPSSAADAPYYSKDGRGSDVIDTRSVFRNAKNYTDNPFLKLAVENQPTKSWPFRGFDDATIDKLAVVSVAGVCAEILAYGNAEGGVADFSQLRQLFSGTETELNERDMENRIRYSIAYTMTQLRLHLGALDALAQVMERDGSVAECVEAIETCPNVNRHDGISGDYDLRRRERFRSQSVNILEKFLLGEKAADTEEDRFVEGKGGGYIKTSGGLQDLITGDDPLYIALGVAFLFLAWSVGGGLSLH
jgi:hypothetical protein